MSPIWTESPRERPDLTCEQLVELVTEYLEGGPHRRERERFEEHVIVCGGCANYLDQMRTIRRARRPRDADDLTDETKAELLAAFRDWKSGVIAWKFTAPGAIGPVQPALLAAALRHEPGDWVVAAVNPCSTGIHACGTS